MADNVNVTEGSGKVIAADDISSVFYQRVKLSLGADGSAVDAVAGSGNVGTGVQRVTIATDDVNFTALLGYVDGLEGMVDGVETALATLHADLTTPANFADSVGNRIIIATGSTLTRPANTTAYAANDSVSDNATAGSVTANTVTISATNDYPVGIAAVELHTTDTGFGAANIRMWVYNSDPTASSGVVGGDNAAFSNKKAGFVGCLSGTFRAFSDGSRAVLTPDEGSLLMTLPTSGAKTLYWQLQTLSAATPSANSTTFIPTFRAYQGAP
jgi:hypothetical protein